MPYKSEKMSINNELLDRRVKLLSSQKIEIAELYKTGNYSLNGLAKQFNVSKKTIFNIVNPEKLEISKQQYKERRKDGRYYDKEVHRKAMQSYRKYKHTLYLNGELNND